MPKPITAVNLKDITTNKLYPAYQTQKGTIIQLNGTKTHLPTGATLSALVSFADECSLKTVIITAALNQQVIVKVAFMVKT